MKIAERKTQNVALYQDYCKNQKQRLFVIARRFLPKQSPGYQAEDCFVVRNLNF
jgi:hypothetical protein